MHEIVDRVFVGNIRDAQSAVGFDAIINCTRDVPFFRDDSGCVKYRHRVAVEDNRDPQQQKEMAMLLMTTVRLMDSLWADGNRILVHCLAGHQRSPTIVAAWLMFRETEFNCINAILFIKSRRPEAFFEGGVHFAQALNDFEKRRPTKTGLPQPPIPKLHDVVWTSDIGMIQVQNPVDIATNDPSLKIGA